ncbi:MULTISPECIES: hypothetical protein [unclassified Micromonospora]|uniref:hypothetical protein n=1 Tax=unclassified Micromonospora TaxID=2617518 RepID=UPI000626F380|nr:hypothetical protein [Micromonospora sp. HK10]KKJ98528.1 hypothetical protein LQ51_24410 [Micromonospora sp. HK10]
MRGKIMFLGGLAAGFVLGARAGREKYEELVVRGRKVLDHPTVQEAAGVAQAQATRLYSEGKDKLGQTKLGEKLSTGNGSKQELTGADKPFAGTPATVGAKAGSTGTGSTSTTGSSTTSTSSKSSGTSSNGSTL